MTVHTIRSVQKIPASLQEVWALFSDPNKLQEITPADMRFRVISTDWSDKIFPGQIIEYKVSPLLGIPLYWKTEIMDVRQGVSFIDEQRKGPYSLWHHEHHFREIEGGVEMIDLVRYRNPLGVVGRLANKLLVRKKLRQIFQFRYSKIEELFGTWKGQQVDIVLN
jgi:ligand-binding SRPBCC domain-containing protein